MPTTSHFRTDAEVLLPNGNWLSVVVDLREDSGDLLIETNGNEEIENQKTDNVANVSAAFNDMLPSESGIRVININKGDEGLGISIKGGHEHRMPIIISKIFRGMAADRTRQLYVGDAILSVNGVKLQNAKHEDAVRVLRSAGHKVTIEVQYMPVASPMAPQHSSGDKITTSESLPLLSKIGWGNLQALSPANNAEEIKEFEEGPDKSSWWRRVSSLRLVGVQLLQSNAHQHDVSPSIDWSVSANRVLRIHSADVSRSIFLRFASPPIAGCWLSWLTGITDQLADRFRDRANLLMTDVQTQLALQSQMTITFPGQFWQIGWLDQLSPPNALENDKIKQRNLLFLLFSYQQPKSVFLDWIRVFAAITDREMLLFDRAPAFSQYDRADGKSDAAFKASVCQWLGKHEIARIPLIFSRLVSGQFITLGSTESINSVSNHLVFGIRLARVPPRHLGLSSEESACRDSPFVPVESRTFHCESTSSLAVWCRSIVAGCHRAVAIAGRISFAVIFKDRVCALDLSEDRLTLYDLEATESHPKVIWSKPLSSVSSSSDDGNRQFLLDVNGIGTMEFEMASEADLVSNRISGKHLTIVHSPKPIVFALHSFLSAKLASLGIIA